MTVASPRWGERLPLDRLAAMNEVETAAEPWVSRFTLLPAHTAPRHCIFESEM